MKTIFDVELRKIFAVCIVGVGVGSRRGEREREGETVAPSAASVRLEKRYEEESQEEDAYDNCSFALSCLRTFAS
jgi:hypothetical protein